MSTQLTAILALDASTPLARRRWCMRCEMVLTTSKRRISQRSAPATQLRMRCPLSSPRSNAASTSKSCTCSQALAPLRRATATAAGAQNRAGSTTHTSCGRQATWASSTGRLLSAKLAKCSSRLTPPGWRGTHCGQR